LARYCVLEWGVRQESGNLELENAWTTMENADFHFPFLVYKELKIMELDGKAGRRAEGWRRFSTID
jgi:hypothetical protein